MGKRTDLEMSVQSMDKNTKEMRERLYGN